MIAAGCAFGGENKVYGEIRGRACGQDRRIP